MKTLYTGPRLATPDLPHHFSSSPAQPRQERTKPSWNLLTILLMESCNRGVLFCTHLYAMIFVWQQSLLHWTVTDMWGPGAAAGVHHDLQSLPRLAAALPGPAGHPLPARPARRRRITGNNQPAIPLICANLQILWQNTIHALLYSMIRY